MEENKMPDSATFEKELLRLAEEDPEYNTWFSKYRKSDWARFISSYAIDKKTALNNKEWYIKMLKPKSHEFKQEGELILQYIQQKKLFNLQCLWRAEKITLPFVRVSDDFNFWGQHIMECPFLPPVTEEEIDMYIKFLQNEVVEAEVDPYLNWQNYDDFIKYYKEEEDQDGYYDEIPEWYVYADTMYGTTYLSSLPDIRGEKELKYVRAYNAEKYKDEPVVEYVPSPEMSKEILSYPYEEEKKDFARAFEQEEDAHAIIGYINHSKVTRRASYWDMDELDEDYEFLKKLDEEIELVPHKDWRMSIHMTVHLYKANKIAQHLPGTWRRYYRKEVGNLTPDAYVENRIANWKFTDKHTKHYRYIMSNTFIEEIFNGRELAGEPRNLDF